MISSGKEVLEIQDTSTLEVEIRVPENEVGRRQKQPNGQTATMTFPAIPDRSVTAKLAEWNVSADPVTRSYALRFTFPMPNEYYVLPTDVIEEAIQEMGQVEDIYSTSQEGFSFVYVDMKSTFKLYELPQIWNKLRRKINDIQEQLPPGAGPSVVNDDFDDVYGVFFAITGEGLSNAQLKEYADSLKKELLLCDDVGGYPKNNTPIVGTRIFAYTNFKG